MDDLHDWVALAQLEGFSLAQKHRLLSRFNSPSKILKLKSGLLKLSDGSGYLGEHIDQETLVKTLSWQEQDSNHHLVHFGQQAYPELLRQTAAPPLLLYLIGNLKLLASKQIAIVGSRKATMAGQQIARQFAGTLSRRLTVTSGMALGIDSCAHMGALEQKGKTVAVLGTGVDLCYPPGNKRLYQDIAKQGLLVSEFKLASPPRREHFPRRNRIISGLSLGTLVVEAAQRSGSLITAAYALEQNREVFAVPGSILSNTAAGCLGLIQQGAKLTCTVADILDEFSEFSGRDTNNSLFATHNAATHPKDTDSQLLDLISDVPVSFDKLICQSGLTVDQLCSILLDYELEGIIEKLPGNQYLKNQ